MKSILSPYNDTTFNEYLLDYVKKRLKQKCLVFTKDDSERKYYLDDNSTTYFTYLDIIKSLQLVNGREIRFENQALINHIVYDLSQRFWYNELKNTNNLIHKIYFQYKQVVAREENSLQPRKLSHNKRSPNRLQEARK